MIMRKSLYDISLKISEEEYRADPAISYSTLAKFSREGVKVIPNLFDKISSPSLTFGSMVDSLLTGGNQEFEERFLVADFPDIPDSQVQIIKSLYNLCGSSHRSLSMIPDSLIIEQTEVYQFQRNWKPETRSKVIKENGEVYYSLLTLAKDKEVVSTKIYQDAVNCVEALKLSNVTSWYFQEDNPFDGSIERMYQLKFKGVYENIPIRCMADLIIVNHDEGTIQMIDLKTTKDVTEFQHSFYVWQYFHQAQMYSEILRQNIIKDDYYKNFKILPYLFIAIDRFIKQPVVYKYDRTFSKEDTFFEGKWYDNWRKQLPKLKWHIDNPHIRLPYNQYMELQSKGHITIRGLYPIVEEQWKEVEGYEGFYEISNLGNLKRLERKIWSVKNNSYSTMPEKIIIPETLNGYLRVRLTKNGEGRHFYIHQLVGKAFIDNPHNFPNINHIDENPKNNRWDNLEWCDPDYNSNYGSRNYKISERMGIPIQRFSLEGVFIDEFKSAAEACRVLGLPENRQSNISAVCRGIRRSSLGYIWRFKK